MKRIFLSLALALLAVSVSAQGRYNYDSSHKYGFFSNWTLGVSGQYSNQHGVSNVGISALATKRVGDYWRLRYEASISGLKQTEGFDRYGTVMSGVAFDFIPYAYAFLDAGAMVNPTVKGWLGLAADAGLGLNVNFGQHSLLYAEAGADRVQSNGTWGSTVFARLGYSARLGITEKDRVNIDIDRHVHEGYGELKQENALLKTDLKRQQEANDTLMATLNRASELFAVLEKKLDDCNDRVAKVTSTGTAVSNPIFQIFFDYASSEISPIEAGKVAQLAEYIKTNEGSFRIEGYSSPDGDPYRNEVLSGDRARAVYWLLISYGVDEDRIIPMQSGISTQYGEDSPLNRMVVVSANKY